MYEQYITKSIRKENIMSYGVWRKRGKGWATVEIDSPWNYTMYDLRYDKKSTYDALWSKVHRWRGWVGGSDNPTALSFLVRHTEKGRTVIEWCVGGGEHCTWFAFDDLDSLQNAMEKNYMQPMSEDWVNLLAYAKRKTGGQI